MTSLLQTVGQERVALRTAAWLKELRRQLGLSQKKLGEAARVHRNTVSSWERAKSVPTLSQVEDIKLFEKNLRRAKGLR